MAQLYKEVVGHNKLNLYDIFHFKLFFKDFRFCMFHKVVCYQTYKNAQDGEHHSLHVKS